MAYEPTQWRSGDTITSERLNKMEQGIAGSGSGEFYALHTTVTETTVGSDNIPTTTFPNVELREDGLPMWLIVDNASNDGGTTTYTRVGFLESYNNEIFGYDNGLNVNRSTGEVELGDSPSTGGKA